MLATETDPPRAAKAAGLRYVSDTRPGIRRVRAGGGFRYVDPSGAAVRDADTLRRIKGLAIPPAWEEVWISPSPEGHVQASGRDARGRKQYRYHARWRAFRDRTKFDRMIAFARALPAIRARVERDLALPGLVRDKVLATVVRLLEATRARVGNREYERANRSYGLTTLKNHHARVKGAEIR
ncbi:MAG TPA: DNA topoisomerase IB, partial [Planctomycetota bacterium]|nr:DNA topoisomerase IB [Planctomycetota bacterium]